MQRRTKIVCTIGPASSSPEMLRRLIASGMNVARLNFSHGSHEGHRVVYENVRAAARELNANVAILMDLQGPKIRTGRMTDGLAVELVKGAAITITTRDVPGDVSCVSTTYQHLPQDVKPGDAILIADGLLELRVTEVVSQDVHCEVLRGGMLGQHKGINLPGIRIAEPSLTEKDREDLEFGLSLGVDYVALSFVRSADDIRGMRAVIDAVKSPARIVAKIERPEALDCFEEIVEQSDAIMVARGDLGVEMRFEDIPIIQKHLIRTCNEHGVPVITATQMLESMVEHARPTRAEATDIANAVFDGTDALMLSGETASGQFPAEACEVMARIAAKADEEAACTRTGRRWAWLEESRARGQETPRQYFSEAIGLAVSQMTDSLNARQVVCFTHSGFTAAAIARCRPNAPITALTQSEQTMRHCALLWGVSALQCDELVGVDAIAESVDRLLLANGLAKAGDTVIIVGGTPQAVAGHTNFLKLHTAGSVGNP